MLGISQSKPVQVSYEVYCCCNYVDYLELLELFVDVVVVFPSSCAFSPSLLLLLTCLISLTATVFPSEEVAEALALPAALPLSALILAFFFGLL